MQLSKGTLLELIIHDLATQLRSMEQFFQNSRLTILFDPWAFFQVHPSGVTTLKVRYVDIYVKSAVFNTKCGKGDE